MSDGIVIQSRDYWVKVVSMLQQNWALVEMTPGSGVVIYFLDDAGGVFDQLPYRSVERAVDALKRNGFRRYSDDEHLASFLYPPPPQIVEVGKPDRPIYSSGRFWK